MKARLISVLLVIALLVTVGIVAVQAAPTSWTEDATGWNDVYEESKKIDFSAGTVHTCPACGAVNATWTALTANTALTGTKEASVHYYLSADVTLKDKTLSVTNKVCLHLNNHKLSSNQTVINVPEASAHYLAIMGDGVVECTGNDEALKQAGSATHLAGGTYKNAENATAPVIILLIFIAAWQKLFVTAASNAFLSIFSFCILSVE